MHIYPVVLNIKQFCSSTDINQNSFNRHVTNFKNVQFFRNFWRLMDIEEAALVDK